LQQAGEFFPLAISAAPPHAQSQALQTGQDRYLGLKLGDRTCC
jgi:hypothetical protein